MFGFVAIVMGEVTYITGMSFLILGWKNWVLVSERCRSPSRFSSTC